MFATAGFVKKQEKIMEKGTLLWIPEHDKQVKIEIIVAVHCGTGGQRGAEVKEEISKVHSCEKIDT